MKLNRLCLMVVNMLNRPGTLLFSSSLTVYTGPDFYVRFSSEMFKLVWYFDYFLCSNISLWEKVN